LSPFATRNGAAVVELLRLTGFRTWGEFVEETNDYERHLIMRSVEQWHDEQSDGVGGGASGMPGL